MSRKEPEAQEAEITLFANQKMSYLTQFFAFLFYQNLFEQFRQTVFLKIDKNKINEVTEKLITTLNFAIF